MVQPEFDNNFSEDEKDLIKFEIDQLIANKEKKEELEFLTLASKLAKKILIWHFLTHDAIEFHFKETTILWSLKGRKFTDLALDYQKILNLIINKADQVIKPIEHKW